MRGRPWLRLSAAASRTRERGDLPADDTTRVGLTPLDVAVLAGVRRAGLDTFATVLAATVGLLLVVGCAAVALLLFVRIEARRTEFATRLALGGSVARLVGGLALEAAIVAGAGVLAALPVALVGAARRPRFRPPGRRGRVGARRRPRRAGGWPPRLPPACARSRPSPAWPRCTPRCARRPPTCSRRRPPCGRGDAAGSATPCSRPRWRWLCVLVTGALVFVASLRAALSLNAPVAMEAVASASLDLTPLRYDPVRAAATFADVQARLSAHP